MADILEAKRPTIAQCKAEIIILRNRNSELNTTLHSAKITSEQLRMSINLTNVVFVILKKILTDFVIVMLTSVIN